MLRIREKKLAEVGSSTADESMKKQSPFAETQAIYDLVEPSVTQSKSKSSTSKAKQEKVDSNNDSADYSPKLEKNKKGICFVNFVLVKLSSKCTFLFILLLFEAKFALTLDVDAVMKQNASAADQKRRYELYVIGEDDYKSKLLEDVNRMRERYNKDLEQERRMLTGGLYPPHQKKSLQEKKSAVAERNGKVQEMSANEDESFDSVVSSISESN